MKSLDFILGHFRWYRKKRRGTWYLMTPNAAPFTDEWVRKETNPVACRETILIKIQTIEPYEKNN